MDSFVYLGAKITWNNDSTEEVKRRIQLATGAYGELRTVWKDKGIRLETKVQLLWTCVFSVFLYAADTWTISKTVAKRILAFENRCYRWLLEIKWWDHITNEEVRTIIGMKSTLMDIIKSRKLKLFGHVARMNDDRLLKMVTFGMVEGCRPRGRPPRRWIDDITEWCEMDLCEVIRVAMDREIWRTLTTSPDGQLAMGWRRRRRSIF